MNVGVSGVERVGEAHIFTLKVVVDNDSPEFLHLFGAYKETKSIQLEVKVD